MVSTSLAMLLTVLAAFCVIRISAGIPGFRRDAVSVMGLKYFAL